jgi:hypothetical protein
MTATAPQKAEERVEDRAGGRRLVSGVLWNALGRGIPLLLALALTPVLVHMMGIERWGLFTLALALVGIFGVFDLGARCRSASARAAGPKPPPLWVPRCGRCLAYPS